MAGNPQYTQSWRLSGMTAEPRIRPNSLGDSFETSSAGRSPLDDLRLLDFRAVDCVQAYSA